MKAFSSVLLSLLGLIVTCSAECLWDHSVEEPSVRCKIRILDFRQNASVPGLESVRKLDIHCSDVFFFESQLRSDHFGELKQLKHLSIRYCKIRQLPPRSFVGLSQLRKLSINTHNAEWTSLSLEPDYEAFVGLDHLEVLDLSGNNVLNLSPGLLCPLPKIRTFNLSRNSLLDLEQVGMSNRTGKSCEIPLENLILSSNRLHSIPPGSLVSLKRLTALDLSHNNLGVLVENTFTTLPLLQKLDLSHNELVSLPPKIFDNLTNLTDLNLANNSIGTIDISAFSNLTKLQVLNLSGNSLDENWIKPGIFDGLNRLIILDLSSNHISKVDSNLFRDLGALQVLQLSHNQIHSIASNAFRNQINLHLLFMSFNQLETLHHETLNGLVMVKTLALDHNKLHSLHQESLRNCSNLSELSLSNNFLTQVPKAMHNLPSLTNLDLSSNVIGILKRESLQGLPKLAKLLIGKNELSRIGEGTFKEASNLLHLDLGGNRFQKLDQETFRELKMLQSLNLADNDLEDINGLLQTQIKLKWLNMSSNRIQWFDYAFIPPSVQWLDVHENRIDALANYYNLDSNYELKYLDASHNFITNLTPSNILTRIEHLFLSNNQIAQIEPNTFVGKKNLKQVHLQANELETLEKVALHISPHDTAPIFFLADNPFICDCHLQWLSSINSRILSRYPQVMDMDKIMCSVTNHTNHVIKTRISSVAPESFLCEYDKHCLPDCRCCDFFACDCQMKCPDGCTCFHDHGWTANVIQCSAAGFQAMPNVIPMDSTALYIDDNNLTKLDPGILVGRSRLRVLSLNNSNVAIISNQSFAGLEQLKVLRLGHNQLQRLDGYEFSILTQLQELHLEHNQLVSIHSDTFKPLKHLKILQLNGNLLISFPIWELSSNAKLARLTLANNWWQCDCDFIRKFRMFIDGNVDILPDAKQITCTSSDSNLAQLQQCSGIMGGFNGGSGNGFHFKKALGSNLLPLVIGITAFCIGLIISVILFVKMRESLLIWLYTKYGIRITTRRQRKQEPGSEAILFEALMLYSSKDEKFVLDDLIKPIQRSYRLCLLHRDLNGIYSSEAFKSALIASGRHVVVFSKGFLDTEWDYVRDLDLSEKIVILPEDDNLEELLKTKQYEELSKNARKIIRWKDGSFWRKLRYYLPDPPSHVARKEGGAELDVSGVWTFTAMDEPSHVNEINESGTSTTQLLSTTPGSPIMVIPAKTTKPPLPPNTTLPNSPLLNTLLKSTQFNFPAPPVKKQPHQCSTHYLAGAPSGNSPQNNQQRSVSSNLTRSCGTNVAHQRSSSAIVAGSSGVAPPTPPPKMNNRNSVYNLVTMSPNMPRPQPLGQDSIVPTTSGSQQHLLPHCQYPQYQQLPNHHHQRSTSLLETNLTSSPHFVKHGRSVSTLVTSGGTPKQIIQQQQQAGRLQQPSTHGVTRATSMLLSNEQKRQVQLMARGLNQDPNGHNNYRRSASNLIHEHDLDDLVLKQQQSTMSRHVTSQHYHVRSRSTPYEGFVL